MIQMHLLNIETLWMMFTITSMITTQKEKKKVLIVFDDMIDDISSHNKRIVIRCGKLNISLVFITQSYFSVPKEV